MADQVADGAVEVSSVEVSEPTTAEEAIDAAFADEATSPEPTEAVSDETPPSETDDSSPPRDDGRDAKGQFVKTTEDTSEDPPADEAASPEDTPEASEDDVVVEDTATEEATESTEESAEEVVYPEFSYKVDGRDFSLAGSKVGEDGIFIPTAEIERTQRLLGLGQRARQRDREFGQELAAAKASGQERSRHVEEVFNRIIDLRTNDPNGLHELLTNQGQWDLMMANAKIQSLEARGTEVSEQAAADTNAAAGERLYPVLKDGLTAKVEDMAAKYEGVDAKEMSERLLSRHFGQLFHAFDTGKAIPEGMIALERHPEGVIAMDTAFIEDEFEHDAGIIRRTTERTKQTAKVAAANREVLKPAVVSAKKAPPTPKPKAPPKEMTPAESVDHIFGEGWPDN